MSGYHHCRIEATALKVTELRGSQRFWVTSENIHTSAATPHAKAMVRASSRTKRHQNLSGATAANQVAATIAINTNQTRGSGMSDSVQRVGPVDRRCVATTNSAQATKWSASGGHCR